MRSTALLTVIATALALVPACAPADSAWVEGDGKGTDREGPLDAPEGYRALVQQTPWVLDGVSKDGSVVWIRTAESGCNRFHHVRLSEVPGGFRLVALDVVYVPIDSKHGCLLYLLRPRHRVELPRPLDGGEIFGECVPRGHRGRCALLHAVAGLQEGEPERDPWLE